MTLEDVIRRLRDLNMPVPIPLRLPTDAEVTAAERRLGVTFHRDYREFLLKASDVVFGRLEPAVITRPESHTDLSTVCSRAWEVGVPRHLLPICGDNGNYFCMNDAGEVVYWSHDGWSDERWPSLAEWIERCWIGESS